jgi:kelch-like protein 10
MNYVLFRFRCYVSVVVLDDVVYAMGGYNGLFRLKSVERYNYKTNQWSLIGSMNVKRSDASATILNGNMNTIK